MFGLSLALTPAVTARPVCRCELQLKPGHSSSSTSWTSASAALKLGKCTKGSLQPGTAYLFRARAYAHGEWGAWGAVAEAQTLLQELPQAPHPTHHTHHTHRAHHTHHTAIPPPTPPTHAVVHSPRHTHTRSAPGPVQPHTPPTAHLHKTGDSAPRGWG